MIQKKRITKEKRKSYNRNWYKSERHRKENAIWRGKHPKYKDIRRERLIILRDQVLKILGGQCVKCGFSDYRALQIDHVNGGGTKDRRLRGNGNSFLKEVLADVSGSYQLLCANCNWIKRIENNE